jgi:hypothetical protein
MRLRDAMVLSGQDVMRPTESIGQWCHCAVSSPWCHSRQMLYSQEASCRRMGDFQDAHFEIGGLFYALGMADEVARA